MKYSKILQTVEEFKGENKFEKIENPNEELYVASLPKRIIHILNLLHGKVTITRKALKHIVNSREINKADVKCIVSAIPEILRNPTKIVDNSAKTPSSFLFAKMNGKAKRVVLEIIRNENKNQVISAHFIRKGYYLKMKDILGRTAVPPSAVST